MHDNPKKCTTQNACHNNILKALLSYKRRNFIPLGYELSLSNAIEMNERHAKVFKHKHLQ